MGGGGGRGGFAGGYAGGGFDAYGGAAAGGFGAGAFAGLPFAPRGFQGGFGATHAPVAPSTQIYVRNVSPSRSALLLHTLTPGNCSCPGPLPTRISSSCSRRRARLKKPRCCSKEVVRREPASSSSQASRKPRRPSPNSSRTAMEVRRTPECQGLTVRLTLWLAGLQVDRCSWNSTLAGKTLATAVTLVRTLVYRLVLLL